MKLKRLCVLSGENTLKLKTSLERILEVKKKKKFKGINKGNLKEAIEQLEKI